MSYKISGITNENSRIIVIDQNTWAVETNQSGVLGSFELDGISEGQKIVVSRNNLGSIDAFGNVNPVQSGGDRGVFAGGWESGGSALNTIEYITISSPGNSSDFGDLTVARQPVDASCSNGSGSRGVIGGGYIGSTQLNVIDYVTISSIGNAIDFGDLSASRWGLGAASNNTDGRAVFGCGRYGTTSTYSAAIDYVTIDTTGDATNFGNSTNNRYSPGATSNGVNDRAVWSGGRDGYTVIDYVTITSVGDAVSFGNATFSAYSKGGTSNLSNERGVFGGGYYNVNNSYHNIIEYITINSTSNAQDFGDLTTTTSTPGSTSNGVDNRGVFAGGTDGTYLNIIEYINIGSVGNSQDFGDLLIVNSGMAGTSDA